MTITIGLPSGIGDVSWALSKLRHVGPFHFEVADGWPYRTTPYLDLLGPEVVASATYGQFTYTDICTAEQAQGISSETTWAELVARGQDYFLLEPNKHLERGKPLATWLPDLPTDYHYPMHLSAEDVERAAHLLQDMPRPIIGISAASYRGSEAWRTWTAEQWLDCLARLKAEMGGGTLLLMGGHWDDLTSRIADEGGYPDLVGKTSVGAMVAILQHLSHYVGFSSGMGILNTVCHGRTFMLWPDHQAELAQSWADPAMVADATYKSVLWRPVDDVWPVLRKWLATPDRTERISLQR